MRRGNGKRALVLGAAVSLVLSVAGCTPAPGPVELGPDTVVIDVRTPEEYASGHLAGAVNINLQAPTFGSEVAELDPDDSYVVYCKSGNRSAQAVALMQAEGLDVQDAGGIAQAERATGLPRQ